MPLAFLENPQTKAPTLQVLNPARRQQLQEPESQDARRLEFQMAEVSLTRGILGLRSRNG